MVRTSTRQEPGPARPYPRPARGTITQRRRDRASLAIRVLVNVAGATSAAFFARASFAYFEQTHRLIGALFVIEQAWFTVAFLLRRPARAVSPRLSSWLLAAGGTFGGLLLRAGGAHPLWGVRAGFGLQLAGLILVIGSLIVLGRSFGMVAANRGIVTRGPYAVVRHPVYAGYLVVQTGYVLQSVSWRNISVVLLVTACNIGRVVAEERLLRTTPEYQRYCGRVRWRLVPGVW